MNSTYVPLNQVAPGFLFRVPVGVRFNLADNVGAFIEGRFWMNSFTFNRNFSGENDSITETGTQILAGVGLLF